MTDIIHADPRGRPALRKIRLYGSLAKFIGRRTLQADISTAAEAVRFLVANFAGLEQHMADKHYTVITHTALAQDELHDPTSVDTIKIVPVVEGAGPVGRILAGAALIALSFIIPFGALLAPLVLGVGASLVLGGVSQLLTPVPRIDQGEDSITDTKESYNFSGIQQTSRAGTPVPLIYGKTLVGSVVISAGISDEVQTGYAEPTLPIPATPIDSATGQRIGYTIPEPCGDNGGIQSIQVYKDGVLYAEMNAQKRVTYTSTAVTSQDAALVYLGGGYGLFQVANGTQYTWTTVCNDSTVKQYAAANTPTPNTDKLVYKCTVPPASSAGGSATVYSYYRAAVWVQELIGDPSGCSWAVYSYDGLGNIGYAGIFISGTLPGGACQYQPTEITVENVYSCPTGASVPSGCTLYY